MYLNSSRYWISKSCSIFLEHNYVNWPKCHPSRQVIAIDWSGDLVNLMLFVGTTPGNLQWPYPHGSLNTIPDCLHSNKWRIGCRLHAISDQSLRQCRHWKGKGKVSTGGTNCPVLAVSYLTSFAKRGQMVIIFRSTAEKLHWFEC